MNTSSPLGSANKIYHFSDLRNLPRNVPTLAVVGSPIGHSASPIIHTAALKFIADRNQEYANWQFIRCDIRPAQLESALKIFHRDEFRGLSITIPHKVTVQHLVHHIVPSSACFGAFNVLQKTKEGWVAHNTDGYGFANALRSDLNETVAGKGVVIFGAGGGARSASVECLKQRCGRLWLVNRSAPRLLALLDDLHRIYPGRSVEGITREKTSFLAKHVWPEGLLFVNATSIGLNDSSSLPFEIQGLPRPCAVYDMVYNNPQTALRRACAILQIPYAGGVRMLAYQGALAFSIWTGASTEEIVPVMLAALTSKT